MRDEEKSREDLLEELRFLRAEFTSLNADNSGEDLFYRAIVKDQTELISRFLPDGTLNFVNEAYCRFYGERKEDLVGSNFWHHMPDDDREKLRGFLGSFSREEPVKTIEHRVVDSRGVIQWVQWTDRAFFDALGNLLGFQAVGRDITNRKRMEDELREREKIFSEVFHQSPELIIISRQCDGRYIEVNKAFVRSMGYSYEEAIGRTSLELNVWADPLDRARFMALLKERGSVHSRETRLRRKSGETFSVLCSMVPIEIKGEPCLVATIVDLTERERAERERMRLEAQLRQAQKLEAIGTLAGGIAHDFNNILASIIGYTEMALGDTHESNPTCYDLEQVLKAADRARDLVKQILAFSRREPERRMAPVEMGQVVEEALKLLRASLPTTIEIRKEIGQGVAMADATQIHQVVLNLCTNAAHAMEDEGVLDVSLSQVELEKSPDLPAGSYLRLMVSDTGQGMSRETLERIFDPYFTTKEVGKGTGLGLAVVHGIVKGHGGEVRVKSTLGRGTSFEVLIPSLDEHDWAESGPKRDLPGGSERILLVDDEPMVAELGRRMLSKLGYEVVSKTSPEEAIDLFRSNPLGFDLIITDYTMPRMTGKDLARECMGVRPGIPVLICTGFSERLTEEGAREMGIRGYAMKPLDRRELAELIRSVLDGA